MEESIDRAHPLPRERSRVEARLGVVAGFAALLLALGIVYTVGLVSSSRVHDTFHDVRHAFGFPCH